MTRTTLTIAKNRAKASYCITAPTWLTVMVQHAFRSMDTYRTEDSDRFTNVQKFTNPVYAT